MFQEVVPAQGVRRRLETYGMEDIEILKLFIGLLYRRLPRNTTINLHYDISENQNHELGHYQRTLSHYFTLLNYRNRDQREGMYITKIEDIEASLHLLSVVVELPTMELKEEKERYEYLQKQSQGKEVSNIEAQAMLGLSKSQVHRYLQSWFSQNKVKRTGYKYKGYKYTFPNIIAEETALKTLTVEETPAQSMFDQAMEEYEDFQGFENLRERT